MRQTHGAQKQLMDELAFLRERVAELEGRQAEQDRSEHSLRRANARLHSMISAFDGLMYVCSPDFRVQFMNERLKERTGYDGTGDLCYKALHERDSVCPWCVNERVFKGETVRWEIKSPKDDRWFYVVNTPAYNEDGTVSKQAMMVDITESKRAQEELLRSEEKYRELVENANSIIMRMDNSGKVIFFNEYAQRLFGYSEQEIIGRSIVDTIVPEWESTGRNLRKLVEDICRSPELYVNNVNENMRRTGERLWVAWTNKPIRDGDGRISEVLCIGNDITGLRRAEEALRKAHADLEWMVQERTAALLLKNRQLTKEIEKHRHTASALKESEERYRSVVNNIGIGVALISRDLEIVTLNNQMKKWFPGIDVAQKPICYRAFNDPPRDCICSYCPTHETLQDGQVHESVTKTPRGNEIRNYRIVSTPVIDKDGRIVAAIEMVEDITESKKMQERLQESEAMYRTIFETTACGTIIVEEDNTISLFNTEFERLFSCFKDQPEGMRSWTDLVAGDDLKKMREYHSLRLIDPTSAPRNYEAGVFDREGRVRDVFLTVGMLPGTGRSVVSFLDITKRKQAEKALQESEKQLRFLSSRLLDAQEEERRRIARDLHDSIGQSLLLIKLHVQECLKSAQDSSRSKEMAHFLSRLVPTIQNAVEETKRICTGLRPSMLDDLGIIATIRWFCREFQITCPGIHIVRVVSVKENEIPVPLKIVIFRIIQEALNNIAKYSKAEIVNLSLGKAAGVMELTIKDDGVGFDSDLVLSRNGSQRGLGLTGMRERTELSGGSFSMESILGEGTRVRASWPCES